MLDGRGQVGGAEKGVVGGLYEGWWKASRGGWWWNGEIHRERWTRGLNKLEHSLTSESLALLGRRSAESDSLLAMESRAPGLTGARAAPNGSK